VFPIAGSDPTLRLVALQGLNPYPRPGAGSPKDNIVAKENKRGNREAKKPKQIKVTPVAAPLFEKGTLTASGSTAAGQKKKKT